MEVIPYRLTANSQPDLSLSVFLERFSVGTSATSRTIRLFQLGVPTPLGTHVDRGSAVDYHLSVCTFNPRKAAILDGASGVLAVIQVSMKADTATGTMVKHRILQQTTPKALRWKEKKRPKEGDGVAVRDTRKRFRTRRHKRFRGNREETLEIATAPQLSETELSLHRRTPKRIPRCMTLKRRLYKLWTSWSIRSLWRS